MAEDRKDVVEGAQEVEHEAIHNWFELSYAQYLTLPRTALQSMPDEWQARFVECLRELDRSFDWRPHDDNHYWVQMRGRNGWYVSLEAHDPFMDYKRGRRRILSHQSANPCRVCGGNAEIRFVGQTRSMRYLLQCIRCESSASEKTETISGAIVVWNRHCTARKT